MATANARRLFTLEKGGKDGARENCAPRPKLSSPSPRDLRPESGSAFCVQRQAAYIKGGRGTENDISRAPSFLARQSCSYPFCFLCFLPLYCPLEENPGPQSVVGSYFPEKKPVLWITCVLVRVLER